MQLRTQVVFQCTFSKPDVKAKWCYKGEVILFYAWFENEIVHVVLAFEMFSSVKPGQISSLEPHKYEINTRTPTV